MLQYLINRINILVGGRVAEEMFTKSITSGADDDIARATEIAMNIVCRHGMSDFGMLRVSEHSSPQIRFEAECKAIEIIENARKTAVAILQANESVMQAMIEKLLEKEELNQEELREFREVLVDHREVQAIAA